MTTLIRRAAVFDGSAFIGPSDVLIRDGHIDQVAHAIDAEAAEVIDGAGKTLLPGLIDSHVHAFGDALVDALAFGVTTVLDMFTDVGFAARMRREQLDGNADYRADLFSAGNLATAAGGHGTQFGVPVATLASPGEARDFVKARVDEGSDYIKIIWEPGDGTWPTLDEATIAAVIDAAHAHDKIAVIHATRYRHALRAIEMGVDGLAHIFADERPDEEFGRVVADAGAFAVPTLSVVASACGIASGIDLIDEPGFGSHLMPALGASLRRVSARTTQDKYLNAERAVRLMIEAGATVLAGTDANNPGTAFGASLHRELELLARCGMTAPDALAAATSRPAEIFERADRGAIAPGKVADLLLVDGDPSVDLSATRRISKILKRGARFDRDAYLEKVVEAGKTAAAAASRSG